MYSYQERIRYSEVDETLGLSNVALVNFLQDAAILDAQNNSVSIEELYEEKGAWLLGSWQIVILRRPKLNELVTITTFPYEFKGFLGYRNFTIKDEAGEIIVKAASIWSLINLETLKPQRMSAELAARYELGEKLEMEYKPRKIICEGEGKEEKPVIVKRTQIDSNHHMNNSAYVSVALEYLPMEKDVKEIRVEYRNAAYAGEEMIPVIYEDEGKLQVELKGKAGVYAIVELSY